MLQILNFQRETVEKLTEVFVNIWKNPGDQLPIVLKAPTGSGKTVMMAHFLRGLNHIPNWEQDKAFLWITFSDDIAMQSKEKFKLYFENNIENGLLTVADINKGKLLKNDILFLNWQKVVSRAAESRVLRRPDNEVERKETGYYIEDFIDNTHADSRKIILIIDEAHTHSKTELAQNLIDYIKPKVIIHVTATPKDEKIELNARRHNSFVEVDRERVIDEGLIKERIVVQTEEDLLGYGSKDQDEILLDLGIETRNKLAEDFKRLNRKINPLVLIQLPNDDKDLIERGEKTKEEIVTVYLIKMGVDETKIAKWFDKHPRPDGLEDNDDEHEYLLFKQAAGTGWDCPRAQVLVMFREINSDTFYTQTIGRILRMPEPELKEVYKNSPLLKKGYLYTNHNRNVVHKNWDQISPRKEETLCSNMKSGMKNISLPSEYISRVDYGDLSSSFKFQKCFIQSMNKYFGITDEDTLMGKATQKLESKGFPVSPLVTNNLIVNAEFIDFDKIDSEFNSQGKDVSLEMSKNDVEKTFNYYCLIVLKEQTEDEAKVSNLARSWSPLKSALRIWFKSVIGDDFDQNYRAFIYDINLKESSKLRPAITQAIKDYKPVLNKILNERQKNVEEKQASTFTIQEQHWYSDDYEKVESKLCVLDTCYVLKDYVGKVNETEFRQYLDSKEKYIEWWFKNKDYGSEYFAVKYFNSVENKYRLFYPDWIVLFKDGKIGIFDTKKGDTASDQVTADKQKALINKLHKLGSKYIGGIVVKENGIWYLNQNAEYKYAPGKLSVEWDNFEKVFISSLKIAKK